MTNAEISVSKQGHLQPRCHSKAKPLRRQRRRIKNLSSCRGDVTSKQLVSQRCEKQRVFLHFLQLATQQLQLQNGVLHVNFFLQPATQQTLRCKLQEKLPRVSNPMDRKHVMSETLVSEAINAAS